MEENVLDFGKVDRIYLTENRLWSEEEINESFWHVGEKNLSILKHHIGDEVLCRDIFSFLEYEGFIHLGIGSEGQRIEYLKVRKK